MDAVEKGRKDIVKWQLNSSLANNDDVGEDFLINAQISLPPRRHTDMEILGHPLFLALVLRRGVVVFRGTEVDDDDGRSADHPRGRRLHPCEITQFVESRRSRNWL